MSEQSKESTVEDEVLEQEAGDEAGDNPTEEATQDATDSESEASAEAEVELEVDSIEMWKGRALRAQADMANMRKRLETDVEQRTRLRLEALLQDLITVGDHMDLALSAIPAGVRDAEGADGFLMGMQAIGAALESVMRQHGLEFIQPASDAAFDPNQHEAIGTVQEEGLEATRLDLVRRGYKMGSRILRPAQVQIVEPA